ncbi:MAG: hypothetical protein LBV00_08155 [Propionibacteriaceae bacterium]|nr:hypothetical protein [Propionibacteriaceae bacterium]
MNRDEHIFVGDRCAVALPEVGVFVDGWSTTHGEARVRDSAWFARSDPSMVREFELFTNDQPGAQITKNGDRVENDASLNVETMDAQGRSGGISVVLGRTPPGYVNSPAGLMPWQEYMAMDDGDFGC